MGVRHRHHQGFAVKKNDNRLVRFCPSLAVATCRAGSGGGRDAHRGGNHASDGGWGSPLNQLVPAGVVARGGPHRRSAGERERRARVFVPLGLTLRSCMPWHFWGAFGDDRWGGNGLLSSVKMRKKWQIHSRCAFVGLSPDWHLQ